MRCVAVGTALLIAATLPLSGCGQKHPVAYEPPISISDLVTGVPAPDNAYMLLVNEQTEGRFTCPLAIAKLVPDDTPNGCQLAFQATRNDEQAYWTEQVRGVIEVSHVLFLSPRSTRPEGQSIDALCTAADRLGAALLLVYAPNGVGPNSAQVLGVLYDVSTQRALATLHASSRILDDDGEEASPNHKKGDHRDVDARFQAQRQFERHTLACLRELMHRDSPPTKTQPHRWQTPVLERWWVWDR